MGKNETDIVLEKVIELIKKNYAPADSFDQANYTPCTSELYAKLQEFYPADYTSESVVTMLVSAGYNFEEVYLDFVWLLKEL